MVEVKLAAQLVALLELSGRTEREGSPFSPALKNASKTLCKSPKSHLQLPRSISLTRRRPSGSDSIPGQQCMQHCGVDSRFSSAHREAGSDNFSWPPALPAELARCGLSVSKLRPIFRDRKVLGTTTKSLVGAAKTPSDLPRATALTPQVLPTPKTAFYSEEVTSLKPPGSAPHCLHRERPRGTRTTNKFTNSTINGQSVALLFAIAGRPRRYT